MMFANLIVKLLSEAAVRAIILAGLKELAKRTPTPLDDEMLEFFDIHLEKSLGSLPPKE